MLETIRLVVEQGKSGAYFVTSPNYPGLQVAHMDRGSAIAEAGRAIPLLEAAQKSLAT